MYVYGIVPENILELDDFQFSCEYFNSKTMKKSK